MSKKNKWISITLVIIVIAVGIIVYLAQDFGASAPDYNISNSMLYTGEGYEVRYPEGWSLDHSGADAGIVVFTDDSNLRSEMVILSAGEETEKDIREAIDITQEETITISGTTGTLLTGGNLESGGVEQIVFVNSRNSDKLYALIGSAPEFQLFIDTFTIVD